jgi:metal-responsive CopG/Arc/MetJ family transcriptional regulator
MERVRTSVAIPAELLRDVDEIVRRGALSHATLAKVDRALLIALDLPGQFGSS